MNAPSCVGKLKTPPAKRASPHFQWIVTTIQTPSRYALQALDSSAGIVVAGTIHLQITAGTGRTRVHAFLKRNHSRVHYKYRKTALRN